MPQVGFEPMIPVFEQAKTVHDLDRAAGHCDRQIRFLSPQKITIFPAVIYECEIWPLRVRTEHNLRMSENRRVEKGGRKLHNEWLYLRAPHQLSLEISSGQEESMLRACSAHRRGMPKGVC
jgi:hypothetical protein